MSKSLQMCYLIFKIISITVKNVDIFVKVNFVKFVKMKQGINQLFVL